MPQIGYKQLLDDLRAVEQGDFSSDPERDEAMASQLYAAVKMILVKLINEFEQ